MFPPDELPEMPFPVFSSLPLPPWVWARDLYEPGCELSDFGHRSSVPISGYITTLSEECHPIGSSPFLPSKPHRLHSMASSPIATLTAEERVVAILSNQYTRHMSKNRPRWYQGHPLDTAPRCFTPWRRNDVPLISDWATYYRVTAKKAAWMGKVFSHKYYQVNGVIWDWKDPASTLLMDLFSSDATDTVEFAISSDPFRAPHIVVTHSPGEEPEYLDTHGNPDRLTSAPSSIAPNPWGCTPRQSFTGPTGKDQLLLPPRMSAYYERDEYAQLCAAATINRRNIFLRVSIRFQEGLRRVRAQRERGRGRDTGLDETSGSHITISRSEEADFKPNTRDKSKARGFSDTDAVESLMARGIVFQTGLDDLALMAESAIVSEDGEEEDDDDGSVSTSPRSPTIPSDTYEVLRRLGMVDYNAEEEEEHEGEDEGEDEGENEGEEDDSENEEYTGDITIPFTPRYTAPHEYPWTPVSTDSPARPRSPNFNSTLHTEPDEQSSVSSCFIDEDSFGSGSETPDTDEDDC
ncbi:hypothetical protein OPQ81_001490 [Rhizoctonia solani]|nr:hypothetical protein OPQ81_001490 [Rhizoctonia solani]